MYRDFNDAFVSFLNVLRNTDEDTLILEWGSYGNITNRGKYAAGLHFLIDAELVRRNISDIKAEKRYEQLTSN